MGEKVRVAGAKRKRSDTAREEDPTAKLAGKLHHHIREVRKAAKKAKTFEVQKTVKKLKGLRSKTPDSSEIADLEAQLEILKILDTDVFANTALRTKIHKDKLLTSDEHLTAAIAQELSPEDVAVPAAPGSNEAKVQARILSSKIVATEVAGVVEALRVAVSPELKKAKERAVEDRDEEEDDEGADGSEGENGEERDRPASKKAKTGKNLSNQDEDGDSEESDASSRVQAFSDEEEMDDAGWESGSVHEGPGSEDEDQDDSEDEEDDPRPSTSTRKESTAKPAKPQPEKPRKAGESTFLPSLAVGFTRGDSDASDLSDDEDVAPKKNRRGQRARRAIWEKKYGKNANHVKKQQEIYGKDKPADKHGRDGPQRSARGHGHGQGAAKGRSRQQLPPQSKSNPVQDQGWQQRSRGPPPHIQQEKKQEEKSLHPSWAAKKMLKEKQNPSIVAPQGKKIVF